MAASSAAGIVGVEDADEDVEAAAATAPPLALLLFTIADAGVRGENGVAKLSSSDTIDDEVGEVERGDDGVEDEVEFGGAERRRARGEGTVFPAFILFLAGACHENNKKNKRVVRRTEKTGSNIQSHSGQS